MERILYISAGIIFWLTLNQQSAGASVTLRQQQDALLNLTKSMDANKSSRDNGKEFKSVLMKWIQTTDADVLRHLMGSMRKPSTDQAKKKQFVIKMTPHPVTTYRPTTYGSFEEKIPPRLILKRFERMTSSLSSDELKTLLASMKTTEGHTAVSKLGIRATTVDELLKDINGDVEKQASAKANFKLVLSDIKKEDLPLLRDVYKVYLAYDLKQKSNDILKKATTEQLEKILKILARAEKRLSFGEIKFSEIFAQINTIRGKSQAVDAIGKWIPKADVRNLRRFVQYSGLAFRQNKSLRQVKILIEKKIEQKSPEQLNEFLEVLETKEGKVLLGKISVKLTPAAHLLKFLKSGKKSDENKVKRILKDWTYKLTAKDMKEMQSARNIFAEHRARKTATLRVTNADQQSLLKILNYLSHKQSSGSKFGNIMFHDLRKKVEANSGKSLEEVKKVLLEWISKASFEQLSVFYNIQPDNARRFARKGAESADKNLQKLSKQNKIELKPQNSTKPMNKGTVVTTTTSASQITMKHIADVNNAERFNQFINKKNSRVTVTSRSLKKALVQIANKSQTDLYKVFATAVKGVQGASIEGSKDSLFKGKVVKANTNISSANTDLKWKSVRKDLLKWIPSWKRFQAKLFYIWYKRGAQF